MKTVILSFSVANNSVGEYFINLSNGLAVNHNVIIVTDKVEDHPFQIDPSITIERWPSRRPTKLADFRFLLKLFRRAKPTMVIAIFGAVNMFLIAGFLTNVKNRICWIRTLSTQFPQQRMKVLRKSWVYKLATRIITNSESTRRDAISVFGVPNRKIQVLPNAVTDNHDRYSVALSVRKIVYAGRLHPSKGVDVLIKAFSIINKAYPDAVLEIIGSGPMHDNLASLVADNKIEEAVVFKGSLPKDEVMNAFASAYCSVIPSYSEAFGYTVIESMSVKTCVIGADNTGISEIIVDGISGLLFKTGDPADLSDKIIRVLNNPDLRNKLAQGGYDRFQSEYELTGAITRDLKFFNELL